MKLICELFRKTANSSVHGKCYENLIDANKKINSKNFTELVKALNNLDTFDLSNQVIAFTPATNHTDPLLQKKIETSAIYLVVVMCFYSLSLLILVFLNVKFNLVFRKSLGRFKQTLRQIHWKTEKITFHFSLSPVASSSKARP